LFVFSALTLAVQHFTRKHCLKMLRLRMRSVTWNPSPVKKFVDRVLASPHRGELRTWI